MDARSPDDGEQQRWLRIRALDARGDHEAAHNQRERARLYQRLADEKWYAGKDPSEACRCAIASAGASLSADPADPFMLQVLADSFWCLGEQEAHFGADPTASCLSAAEAYDRALAIRPADGAPWNGRCNVFRLIGEWLFGRGGDPGEQLARAVESGTTALRFSDDLRAHYGLARANLALAIWLVRRGESPVAPVEGVVGFAGLLHQRRLNSAEAAWVSGRDFHTLREWRQHLGALKAGLRAQPGRADFRAISDRLDLLK